MTGTAVALLGGNALLGACLGNGGLAEAVTAVAWLALGGCAQAGLFGHRFYPDAAARLALTRDRPEALLYGKSFRQHVAVAELREQLFRPLQVLKIAVALGVFLGFAKVVGFSPWCVAALLLAGSIVPGQLWGPVIVSAAALVKSADTGFGLDSWHGLFLYILVGLEVLGFTWVESRLTQSALLSSALPSPERRSAERPGAHAAWLSRGCVFVATALVVYALLPKGREAVPLPNRRTSALRALSRQTASGEAQSKPQPVTAGGQSIAHADVRAAESPSRGESEAAANVSGQKQGGGTPRGASLHDGGKPSSKADGKSALAVAPRSGGRGGGDAASAAGTAGGSFGGAASGAGNAALGDGSGGNSTGASGVLGGASGGNGSGASGALGGASGGNSNGASGALGGTSGGNGSGARGASGALGEGSNGNGNGARAVSGALGGASGGATAPAGGSAGGGAGEGASHGTGSSASRGAGTSVGRGTGRGAPAGAGSKGSGGAPNSGPAAAATTDQVTADTATGAPQHGGASGSGGTAPVAQNSLTARSPSPNADGAPTSKRPWRPAEPKPRAEHSEPKPFDWLTWGLVLLALGTAAGLVALATGRKRAVLPPADEVTAKEAPPPSGDGDFTAQLGRLRHMHDGAAASAAVIEVYQLLLRHLEGRGWPRQLHQTPDEFALSIGVHLRQSAEIRDVTRVFCAVFYGRRAPTAGQYQAFLAAASALGASLPEPGAHQGSQTRPAA